MKVLPLTSHSTTPSSSAVWQGTYPQVMFTLFKDINLTGKTKVEKWLKSL